MFFKQFSVAIVFILTLVLCLSPTQAKPSDAQIAAFKQEYNKRLDAYLATKSNSTATCIDGLITQMNMCKTAPYNRMVQYSLHGIGDLGS